MLRGFPRAQFEIAGVEQRVAPGEKAKLCRTKDVTRGQQEKVEIMDTSSFAKWQYMLCSFARQSSLHQTCGALGDEDLVMWRNVVTVRM